MDQVSFLTGSACSIESVMARECLTDGGWAPTWNGRMLGQCRCVTALVLPGPDAWPLSFYLDLIPAHSHTPRLFYCCSFLSSSRALTPSHLAYHHGTECWLGLALIPTQPIPFQSIPFHSSPTHSIPVHSIPTHGFCLEPAACSAVYMTWQPRVDPCFLDLDLEFEIRPMFLVCLHSSNVSPNATLNVSPNATLNVSPNTILNVSPNTTLNVSSNAILNVSSNAILNAILNASSNVSLNVTPTHTTCDRKEHERENTTREKQAT